VFDKGRLSVERIKTVLFFTETRSVVGKQRLFRAHFQTQCVSSFKTIHNLYNQFNNHGSVLEMKRLRLSFVRYLENIDTVRMALQRSPSKSTRKAAAQVGISRRLMQRILKSDFNLHPYKMIVLLKLTVQNKHQRMVFAKWAQNDVCF
jgi:hypothetical protein